LIVVVAENRIAVVAQITVTVLQVIVTRIAVDDAIGIDFAVIPLCVL
jgi:hypothetical protein